MTTDASNAQEILKIGHVIEVDGENFVVAFDNKREELTRQYQGEEYTVGAFGTIVKVNFGERCVYGRIGRLRLRREYEKERGIESQVGEDDLVAEVTGFGEGEWMRAREEESGPSLTFKRGMQLFPYPSQKVYFTPKNEILQIFSQSEKYLVSIGEHTGSNGIPAFADMNELLGKHTGILGSTGTGKSCTVAAVIHSVLERGKHMKYSKWSPTIVMLDPHNEYSRAFQRDSVRLATDEGSLVLPHWLLNLDETIALILGRNENVSTSDVNIMKRTLWQVREANAKAIGITSNDITIDSPIPYTLDQLKESLESWRKTKGSEEGRSAYNAIVSSINVVQRDSRLTFLTKDWDGKKDPISDILKQFVGEGPPVRIVDLSGVPDEVAGITSGVIARMLFNFQLWQSTAEREKHPILLACEEAHRYVPDKGEAQYAAAQKAIRRIAKEGRKYGLGLMLISQRPSELEATVLSQCNSLVIMRVTNETDLNLVRSILPDSMQELSRRISELRRQEAIFVGQAAVIPSRILIRSLNPKELPRSTDIDYNAGWQSDYVKEKYIHTIAMRWRTQQRPTE